MRLNSIYRIILACFIIFLAFTAVKPVFAQSSGPGGNGLNLVYPEINKITLSNTEGQTPSLSDLVNYIIDWIFAISGLLAFALIVFGGVQYLMGDSKQGGEKIKNAIVGLVIVLCSYVILKTINPNLINFNIPTPSFSSSASTPTSATAGIARVNTAPNYARGAKLRASVIQAADFNNRQEWLELDNLTISFI